MTIPNFQAFMLPVLKVAAQGEQHIQEIFRKVPDLMGISEEDRALMIPSGKFTTVHSRAGWARTYLNKAGLIARTKRAHYTITDEGRRVLAEAPAKIDIEYLRRFPSFVAFQDGEAEGEEAPLAATSALELPPGEAIRRAHAQLEASLASDLLDRIQEAAPSFFEGLVVQLLEAMGFGGSIGQSGRTLGRSGDGGVDGVIDQDALGLDRIYVQAKRYMTDNTVGAGAIRDFFGALDRHKAAKGLFVTTSRFTNDAEDTASYLSKRIVLIDGKELTRLMIRYGVGCRVEDTLKIMKIDEDFFEEG